VQQHDRRAVALDPEGEHDSVGALDTLHAPIIPDTARWPRSFDRRRRWNHSLVDPVQPLERAEDGFGPILERVPGRRYVLLGEASHGTHDFYRARAELTKRLIIDHGITAVVAEADWPDAYRVNRFVRGQSDDADADEALRDFRRFPGWMWRNTDVLEFVSWLREWNDSLDDGRQKVGFYGLDLYSLYTSMDEVISYLEQIDPDAAARARERYSCFDHVGRDPNVYAYAAGIGDAEPCEQQVVDQLVELRRLADEGQKTGWLDADEQFYAEQNALLIVNAEQYYRELFRGGTETWNLRDRHMADMLDHLVSHLDRTYGRTKVALWAHNSHLGDARATEMAERGELNLGQLVRERHRDLALLVGFTTYTGTVTAASDWGGQAERKWVRPALDGSWESLLHESGYPGVLLMPATIHGRRLERAIGVIYRPETERLSHYFHARLDGQFDVVVHIDETTALEPLERSSEWVEGELPETYPWAV
jgi:erythromycin esterase-like protein